VEVCWGFCGGGAAVRTAVDGFFPQALPPRTGAGPPGVNVLAVGFRFDDEPGGTKAFELAFNDLPHDGAAAFCVRDMVKYLLKNKRVAARAR